VKNLLTIILFLKLLILQSQNIETKLIDSISLNADTFIGVDYFKNFYYTKGTTFYKKTTTKTYSYTNTQLGEVSSIDITNPLKIVLFYRDFNTVVILDNRLNELTDSINFATEVFAKNVAFASISSNNNLWIYSLDDNILSLWNYETKQTIFNTQPLSFYTNDFEATLQTSTYEYCWLSSKEGILKFNEYGSFIEFIEHESIKHIRAYGNGVLFLKNDALYYHKNNKTTVVSIPNAKHKLDNFTVIKNNLYFFDANVVYTYTVLKK